MHRILWSNAIVNCTYILQNSIMYKKKIQRTIQYNVKYSAINNTAQSTIQCVYTVQHKYLYLLQPCSRSKLNFVHTFISIFVSLQKYTTRNIEKFKIGRLKDMKKSLK